MLFYSVLEFKFLIFNLSLNLISQECSLKSHSIILLYDISTKTFPSELSIYVSYFQFLMTYPATKIQNIFSFFKKNISNAF